VIEIWLAVVSSESDQEATELAHRCEQRMPPQARPREMHMLSVCENAQWQSASFNASK
jgi:hypothetical protein